MARTTKPARDGVVSAATRLRTALPAATRFVSTDPRQRVSLGTLATHDTYAAIKRPDGAIILIPIDNIVDDIIERELVAFVESSAPELGDPQ